MLKCMFCTILFLKHKRYGAPIRLSSCFTPSSRPKSPPLSKQGSKERKDRKEEFNPSWFYYP